MNRAADLAAGIALIALTSGCVPIPYSMTPGFRGSRADLGDGVPEFISVGSTKRDEVLLKLPRPEVAAPDNSWFYYESDYLEHSSGAVFLTGAPVAVPIGASGSSAQLFRRLYIRFDDKGTVNNADFDRQGCPNIIYPLEPTSEELSSCAILKRGLDLREESLSHHVRSAAGERATNARRYNRALWKEGAGLPSVWANLSDDPLNCYWARKRQGTLVVTATDILFLPAGTTAFGEHPVLRVEREQVVKIAQFGPSIVNVRQTAGWEITQANGRVAALTLCEARNFPAMESLKEAGLLLGVSMH